MNDKLTVKYTPTSSQREHNIFTEEYFSGADVAIYIDGELVKNISTLSYQIQEQLKPLFGYASRTYDDVAIGNRIVVGTLRIPISNPEENSDQDIKEEIALSATTNDNLADNNGEGSNSSSSNMPSWASNSNDILTSDDLYNYGSSLNKNSSGDDGYINNKYDVLASLSPLEYNDDLKDVQKRLLALGYNVEINGYYDTKTKNAIIKVQHNANLNETGIINDETIQAIAILEGNIKDQQVKTSTDTILRAGPGEFYDGIFNVASGTDVMILNSVGDWYMVQISNGSKGYINKVVLLK